MARVNDKWRAHRAAQPLQGIECSRIDHGLPTAPACNLSCAEVGPAITVPARVWRAHSNKIPIGRSHSLAISSLDRWVPACWVEEGRGLAFSKWAIVAGHDVGTASIGD